MKLFNFFKEYFIEFSLFLFFFIYFIFWHKLNFPNIVINNNGLDVAIKVHKFNPYLSYFLFKITELLNIKIFFGFILFPSLVAVILYKIFNKLSGSKLWGVSLTFLSMISTENYQFINFLESLFNVESYDQKLNLYENFEIQGFPLPSFSVFYFCSLFFVFFNTIKLKTKNLYILSTLWIVGPLIHPFDGIIGLIFWNLIVFIYWKFKKIEIQRLFFFYLLLINSIVFIIILSQLNLDAQIIFKKQMYSMYNFMFYFLIPLILTLLCIKYFKVDLYEFNQKFLGIFILFMIEFSVIIFSILGFGLDLRMTETRLSMFLLHFLYYMPIIYYLNKDSFLLISRSEKVLNYQNMVKKILYIIFCKLNKVYLPCFCFIMIIYLVGSINL